MSQSRWYVAVVVVAGLVAPTLAQDSVDLHWKFEKSKPFYQEMTTKTEQKMKVLGMDVGQTQEQTFFFSWTPVEQDKDKNWVIRQKIEGVRMKIDVGGNPINYDSTKENNGNNPLADFFKAIVGAEFTLTLGPDGKVTKIVGREDFLKKLILAHQQMEPLLTQILSDEALKQMADPAFAAVPNKTVKKGESWERKSTLNMGPIGTYDSTFKYTFEGPDAKEKALHVVKVENTLLYKPPDSQATGGAALPFKIKSADLKVSDAGGQVLIDPAKGRPVTSTMHMKLGGKLNIEISGQATEVDLTQTQETTVRTTDENPVKKSAP